ncbi:hypothetical protein MJ923_14875 [Shewanella sp. 3B26]|uniref:Uncharacterized protein n=1 Tax=Shewanella zhuhaiensis TaxID=2919576 RepID=A0AAJ1BIV8_9GAMM|nr:hypothetical protein [Shewanella zhuhaiensis]MCH4295590.1 hypothetical protein [Shewanella zhuhaiensis]
MAFIPQRQRSAVNSAPMVTDTPKRIQNKVYRQCALDGFHARIERELSGQSTALVPLYSHHATRQSFYEQGWHAVTPLHLMKAQAKARTASSNTQSHSQSATRTLP